MVSHLSKLSYKPHDKSFGTGSHIRFPSADFSSSFFMMTTIAVGTLSAMAINLVRSYSRPQIDLTHHQRRHAFVSQFTILNILSASTLARAGALLSSMHELNCQPSKLLAEQFVRPTIYQCDTGPLHGASRQPRKTVGQLSDWLSSSPSK